VVLARLIHSFDDCCFFLQHFTGSTKNFNAIWKEIAGNLDKYRSYPRIVGETGE
jgi:hypothetical protein